MNYDSFAEHIKRKIAEEGILLAWGHVRGISKAMYWFPGRTEHPYELSAISDDGHTHQSKWNDLEGALHTYWSM